ncbi:twin-arginine translocase subunit TatC [Solirubrobacter soli]|uniref:twin-arginine translocase subunit TatC n=1 Tax=Solirubrobacter soli TaxID=363832 RepID=UPI00041B8AE5|nr:twin-arginine translocase subunit TatC [Solirubrobacter soli]
MSAFPLRPVAFGDELSLTDHLSELRTRLFVCVAALVVLFGGCLWQSRALLTVLDRPLASIDTPTPAQAPLRTALDRSARAFSALSHAQTLNPTDRRAVVVAAQSLSSATRSLGERKPITIGLGEPFSTSVTVAFAFALMLASPLLLWQLWAFIAPAVAPEDRRAVRPLLALAPALLIGGVVFAYELVLPPAVRFLQGFNSGAFDALVQAKDYYHFELLTMLALGAIFQLPVVMLVLGRAGLLSAQTLRTQRRYAIVGLAALAAALPGTDPVTTMLEIVPLIGLYELSIVLLRISERRRYGS